MEGIFDVTMLVAAFGGGLLGAVMGGLPTFIFTGFLVIAGEALFLATGNAALTGMIAFGPFFGPHVAFCGGVAATTFAYKKGLHDNGKDIASGGIKWNNGDWQVMIVGALFGVLGYLVNAIFVNFAVPTDTIALTVFLSNSLARILFGKTGWIGKHDPSVAPNRFALPEDRHNAWLPFQSKIEVIVLLGAAIGGLSGYASMVTESAVIGFGISAATLFFLQLGGPIPVTHHITLPAGLAALATGNVWFGVIFGVFGALLGELGARLFVNWGDSHIDPPAFAIFIATTVVLLAL
jgi:MFS family permease